MSLRCIFGFHAYSKWEYYTFNVKRTETHKSLYYTEVTVDRVEKTHKKRTCYTCGLIQDVFVSECIIA